jgi:phage/conjugal plasmid C-4 type zinc finger TraR family protein
MGSVALCKREWCGQIDSLSSAVGVRVVAGGWTADGAVQQQIDDSIKDAVERARAQMAQGPSLTHCEDCEEPIPEARRSAVPGVRLCVVCQSALDEDRRAASPYNRRGSKDSQLR